MSQGCTPNHTLIPYDRISDCRMGPARWWLECLANVQAPWLTVHYFTYGVVLAR